MSSYQKELIDSIYDAAVLATFTIGYALIGKNSLGNNKPSAKMDMEDWLKMTGYLSAAVMSFDYAKKQGWLPPSIIKK